jgi:hypothetical protein
MNKLPQIIFSFVLLGSLIIVILEALAKTT